MTDERRRFFRIDDEAEVSFKPLSNEEFDAWSDDQQEEEGEQLAKLETEIGLAVSMLKSSHPQFAKIAELLNQKINIAINASPKPQGFVESGELKPINLSACGIAFHTDENIEDNQNILLQLKLKPSNVAIITTGKVVSTSSDAGKKIIRVDFQELSDNYQDLLMQHLFQVQSRALKKQRSTE